MSNTLGLLRASQPGSLSMQALWGRRSITGWAVGSALFPAQEERERKGGVKGACPMEGSSRAVREGKELPLPLLRGCDCFRDTLHSRCSPSFTLTFTSTQAPGVLGPTLSQHSLSCSGHATAVRLDQSHRPPFFFRLKWISTGFSLASREQERASSRLTPGPCHR